MRMGWIVLALVGATAAGCTTRGGNTIQGLAADLARGARVDEVVLVRGPDGVGDGFASRFQARVKDQLANCATGATPLRAEITVSEFKRANPALAYLADASRIGGEVKLVGADGATVGAYTISRAFRAPGVVGVAMTFQAEQQMSAAFADELCARAFGVGDAGQQAGS